jgi:2-polyprenyl-3-methyl-5-hydroxy-6-metoxy-1,4-benzoquinol methylase
MGGKVPLMSETPFSADQYWEERLGQRWGLESVGDRSLSQSFNEWMYRVRRHRFLQQVADLNLRVPELDVLDIGSGTGFYVDLWRRLGARSITGSDLTTVAVDKLGSTFPDVRFRQLDIGGELPADLSRGSFDVVSAYDMFFHIVDDFRFDQAIGNLAALLRPKGLLMFSDTLLTGQRAMRQPAHVKLRELAAVSEVLAGHGFSVVDQRPVFVLMNAPVDSSSTLRRLAWTLVAAPARRSERAGDAIGRMLFPIELRLLKRTQVGPGVRMFACRLSGDEGSRDYEHGAEGAGVRAARR